MKVLASLLAILATCSTLASAKPHDSHHLAARHSSIAKSQILGRNVSRRTCPKQRTPPKADATSSAKALATPTKQSSSKSTGSSSSTSSKSKSASTGSQLLVGTSDCGSSGATKDVTATTGPNGSIDFFDCGIDGKGWVPPKITVEEINAVELAEAVTKSGSPFVACNSYISVFEKYAAQHGYPAIILASFAMQESSCDANLVGPNGEQGLMQLTNDKCGDAPNGNCRDPDFNIKTGAAYFASNLQNNDGSLLLSIGNYNGWFAGMTYADATAAASEGHCWAQNNLDYLQQFLNGWCQNINVYDNSFHLGKYFNLDKCNN